MLKKSRGAGCTAQLRAAFSISRQVLPKGLLRAAASSSDRHCSDLLSWLRSAPLRVPASFLTTMALYTSARENGLPLSSFRCCTFDLVFHSSLVDPIHSPICASTFWASDFSIGFRMTSASSLSRTIMLSPSRGKNNFANLEPLGPEKLLFRMDCTVPMPC